MSGFIQWSDRETHFIRDPSSGYLLEISRKDESRHPVQQVSFTAPFGEKKTCGVTARDMEEYPGDIRDLKVNPAGQYVFVGSGLGEELSYVRQRLATDAPLPLVIDPARFDVMKKMIAYARTLSFEDRDAIHAINRKRLEVLFRRCNLVTSPARVTLINTTLGTVLRERPEIRGIADIVIEHIGPSAYEFTESSTAPAGDETATLAIDQLVKQVRKLEGLLLKPSGILYSRNTTGNGLM